MVTSTIRHTSGAVKYLGDGQIGGYGIVFGSPSQRDLHHEYFTSQTNIEPHWFTERPVLYHHGLDKTIKTSMVGRIHTIKTDEKGVWLQAQLDARHEYAAEIKRLIDQGALGWSSGSMSHLVEIEDGEIKTWPLIEVSLTPSPAEPRGTSVGAIKSAYEELGYNLDEILAGAKESDAAKEHNAKNIEENEKELSEIQATPDEKDTTMATKMMSEEDIETLAKMIGAQLRATMDMDEEDASKMESEVEEEAKARYEKEDDEDAQKSVDIAEVVTGIFDEKIKAWQASRDQKQEAAAKAARELTRRNALRQPAKSFAGQIDLSNETDEPLKMKPLHMIDRRFDHMDAADMALGMMMMARKNRQAGLIPHLDRIMTPEYLRAFAGKLANHVKSEPYADQKGNSAIKSILPVKADEISASNISGQGEEWIGEFYFTDLVHRERFEQQYDRFVQKGMIVKEIPRGGGDTAVFGLEGTDPAKYASVEANDLDATGRPETTVAFSNFGTGRATVTPGEIKMGLSYATILEEDSFINVALEANRQLRTAFSETRDELLMNGDTVLTTTNINYDGGTLPSDPILGLAPYYTASDGLRKFGLGNTPIDTGGPLTVQVYYNLIRAMNKRFLQFRDRLLFVMDIDTSLATMELPEFETGDARGGTRAGTVEDGVVTKIRRIDVLDSGFIPLTDADGKVTGAGNTVNRGTIMLVYPKFLGFAYKRQVEIKTAENIYSGTRDFVASVRMGMTRLNTDAVLLAYNIENQAA